MNLWQSEPWAKFQESIGNKTFRIEEILVLEKFLGFGKCFFEIQRSDGTKEFWKKIISLARKKGSIFCRIAPESEHFEVPDFPIKKSSGQRFPEYTRIIDLSLSEEDIFAQFSQICRRHIRIAEKNGVVVSESDDVKKFSRLSEITARRDGFSAHSREYFEKLISALGDNAKLLTAEKNGKWLSAGIFTHFGDMAEYYYGASSNDFRELNAPTLLQWEAMKWAKANGCQYFDLLGIAPEKDEKHKLAGVSQFKKKFGGKVVHTFPESNIIFSPFWYKIYRFGKFFRKLIKK